MLSPLIEWNDAEPTAGAGETKQTTITRQQQQQQQ